MPQNADISKELREISDLMPGIGNRNVYRVPEGYFESLPQQILEKIHKVVDAGYSISNAGEEIKAISPLLAGLKNKQTFSVPDGYFEQLASVVSEELSNKTTPVYSIGQSYRKWIRYAAAAIVTGAIGIAAFFFINRPSASNNPIAQNSPHTAISGLSDISDAVLSDYLAAIPQNQNIIVDSTDVAFYNTAFVDISDKDLAGMMQEIPDDDLFSYQDDMQIRPVSL